MGKTTKWYIVKTIESVTCEYAVQAESRKDAKRRVQDGEGEFFFLGESAVEDREVYKAKKAPEGFTPPASEDDYNYILSMEYVGQWGEFSDVCRYGSRYYVPWDEYLDVHDTETGEVSKTTDPVVILRVLELVRGFYEADKLAGGAK